MSENKEWKKLNLPATSTYIEFPLMFTGKSKKPGASAFSGLLLSQQFILAIIHTMNKAVGEPAKLTYEFFIEKYGMAKPTVSKGLKMLTKRGIIEQVSRSRYKIIKPYTRKPYVEVDDYLFDTVDRIAYSRKLIIAFLKFFASNNSPSGEFVSSHARIGKAVHLPRSTAGDAIRDITEQGFIQTKKYAGNDSRNRNCFVYLVNPEVLAVKHPERQRLADFEAWREPASQRANKVHTRLLSDPQYGKLIERIDKNYTDKIKAIFRSGGKDSPELEQLEAERDKLRIELDTYFKVHQIRRGVFPPGFFKTDKENLGA